MAVIQIHFDPTAGALDEGFADLDQMA